MSQSRSPFQGSTYSPEEKRRSNKVFKKQTFGEIKDEINAKEYISGETEGSKLSKVLDQRSGVDFAIIHRNDEDISFLAHRTNWADPKPFATFTIGEKEFDKRVTELQKGNRTYPHYTVQSIARNKNSPQLINAAVVHTVDLIKYVTEGEEADDKKSDGNWYRASNGDYWTGTNFYAVSWLDVREEVDSIRFAQMNPKGDIVNMEKYPNLDEDVQHNLIQKL